MPYPAGIPLLSAAFIADYLKRLISLVIASTVALLACGAVGAFLGGAGVLKPTARVLIGGCVVPSTLQNATFSAFCFIPVLMQAVS